MGNANRLLLVCVLLGAITGYVFDTEIAHFDYLLVPVIGIVMLSMGMTLSLQDFVEFIRNPVPLVIGVTLQYLVMPLIAYFLSVLLQLSPAFMAGLVLVGSAPGGTISNVLVYLAGGRVALSVAMTTCSTLLAILLTPLLTEFYLNAVVAVERWAMLISIAWMVLIPVIAGMVIRGVLGERIRYIIPFLPYCAVVCSFIAIAIVTALNAGAMVGISLGVVAGVTLHNLFGLAAGYGCARLLRQDKTTARTIAIEVGTQNSGIAAALAVKHFSVAAAVPATLFSVLQNMAGAALAFYWQRSGQRAAPVNGLPKDGVSS